jgi:hypothetical protein
LYFFHLYIWKIRIRVRDSPYVRKKAQSSRILSRILPGRAHAKDKTIKA